MGFLNKLKEAITGKRDSEQPDFDSHSIEAQQIYKARLNNKLQEALSSQIQQVQARAGKPGREQRRERRQQNIQNRQQRIARQQERLVAYHQRIFETKQRILAEKYKRYLQKHPEQA